MSCISFPWLSNGNPRVGINRLAYVTCVMTYKLSSALSFVYFLTEYQSGGETRRNVDGSKTLLSVCPCTFPIYKPHQCTFINEYALLSLYEEFSRLYMYRIL